MKVNVCFSCNRFFNDEFSYCPFCGEILVKRDLVNLSGTLQREKVNEKQERKDETTKSFYESLSHTERAFVDEFFNVIKSEYSQIEIKHTRSTTYFYRELDKLLSDYGYWFYFTNKNGRIILKYRNTPNAKETPREIKIAKNTDASDIAETILKIIRKRFDWDSYESRKKLEKSTTSEHDEEKKKLPPKPNPKSIFLTGYSPNCQTSSAEGSRTRKTQKDIWGDNKY